MIKPWKTIAASMLVLSIGTALAGCADANTVRQNAMQTREDAQRLAAEALPGDSREFNGKKVNMNDDAAKASQLANRAELVNGVKAADVKLYGSDALVGIEVENIGKRGIIEKQVYSALRIQYPVYRLHITSDQTLRDKIKELTGKPSKSGRMKSLSSEMSVLIKAIDQSFHSRK